MEIEHLLHLVEDMPMGFAKLKTQIAISSRPLFKVKKPSVSSLLEFV